MKLPEYDEMNLVCPVCGKEFKRNDDTSYIVSGGYTCSWNCFLKRVKSKKDPATEANDRENRIYVEFKNSKKTGENQHRKIPQN